MKQLLNGLILFYIRGSFWLLGKVSPSMAANRAWRFMCSPRRYPVKPFEAVALDKATKSRWPYRDGAIQLYTWGSGATKILLVHGWEGQAGNFASLIDPLLAHDTTLMAFDAPSHGASDQQPTSMFDFGACLIELLKEYPVDFVITHSFGSVATAMALADGASPQIDALVMITSPNRFAERIDQVANLIGISPKTKKMLIQQIEAELGLRVSDLVLSEQVHHFPVDRALIIHDKGDKVLPIENSREVVAQWEKAQLIEVEGTGHYRILTAPQTIAAVIQFLFEVESAAALPAHSHDPVDARLSL